MSSSAARFFAEVRTRIARNLLLLQSRAERALRKVMTAARTKLALLVPGSVRQAGQAGDSLRELERLAQNTPSRARGQLNAWMKRAREAAQSLESALAAVKRSSDDAFAAAQRTAAAGTDAARASALTQLGTTGRKIVVDAKAAAQKAVAEAEVVDSEARTAAGGAAAADATSKRAETLFGVFLRDAKRDSARLILTASARASDTVARFLRGASTAPVAAAPTAPKVTR